MLRINEQVMDVLGVLEDGRRESVDVLVVGDADHQRVGVFHSGHEILSFQLNSSLLAEG